MDAQSAVGRIILLSASETSGAAWLCALDNPAGLRWTPLGDRASKAWPTACKAANRIAPLQFRPIGDPETPAGLVYQDHQSGEVPGSVDGASFGLGFALAQLSLSWGLPVPAGWSCSATVDADGNLGKVERLPAKLRAAELVAVERVLVASVQPDCPVGQVRCVPVATLADAVGLLWPDMDNWFAATWGSPQALSRLARHLRDLHRAGHAVVSNWHAVAATAARGIDLAGADHPDRSSLGRSREIARRHAANAGELQLPSDEAIAALCEPDRTDLIADTVQQAADTGRVLPDVAMRWALARRSRSGRDAFPSDLKVLGALARAAWVLHQAEPALAWAEEAVNGWLARENEREASRPLAVWLKVSALKGDGTSFSRAFALAVERVQPFCPQKFWLDEALGVGFKHLGRYDKACEHLRAVVESGDDVFRHVRGSACRHLLGMPGVEAELSEVAKSWLDGDRLGSEAPKYRALAALDRALASNDKAGAQQSLEAVLATEAYPMTTVVVAFAEWGEGERLGAIARWYPY